jgi:hypothetical protein
VLQALDVKRGVHQIHHSRRHHAADHHQDRHNPVNPFGGFDPLCFFSAADIILIFLFKSDFNAPIRNKPDHRNHDIENPAVDSIHHLQRLKLGYIATRAFEPKAVLRSGLADKSVMAEQTARFVAQNVVEMGVDDFSVI